MGKRVKVAGFLLMLGMAMICIPGGVVGGDPNLTPDNNVLYVHYLGGTGESQYWLDADKDANSNEAYEITTNDFSIDFEQNPSITEDMWFLSDADFMFNIHIEYMGLEPTSEVVGVKLYAGAVNVGEGETSAHDDNYVYQISFRYGQEDPIPGGTSFKITITYESIRTVALRLFTDGSSNMLIPLVGDNDSDGIPDSRDSDDDDDGYTDEEELQHGSDPKDPNSIPSSTNGDDGDGDSEPGVSVTSPLLYVVVIIVIIIVIGIILRRRRSSD